MLIDARRLTALTAMAALAAATSACSPVDLSLGEAVKYDQAIQTINPDPVYPPDGAQPGDSGAQAAAATKRYRTDAVKKIEEIKTSNSTTGSSR